MTPDAQAHTTYIRATPEQIWEALTMPAWTRRYFDFIEGYMEIESDWKPGSRVVWRTDEPRIAGEVLEAEPPRRLATTFSLLYHPEEERDPPARLAWEITPLGEDCRVTAALSGAPPGSATARDAAVCLPSVLANLRTLLETGRPRLLKAIVVDCAAPARLAAFWAAVTGYAMQGPDPAPDDPFVGIADPRGEGPEIGFQRTGGPKVGKNRLHLDLRVADVDAEIARLEALGARVAPGYPRSGTHAVMLDPEGNEFCLDG